MHKTTTINLGGQVFNVDEDAYSLLKAYLDNIRHKLAKDDDRDEILKDFEQALAEHLLELMRDKQAVVTKQMTKQVVDAIGDYEVAADEATNDEAAEKSTDSNWRGFFKHPIYAAKQGAVIGGVCAGLARSLEIDPFWLRLSFVILTFLTQGFAILAYVILMLIMKEPKSLSDELRAEGQKPTAAAFVAHSKQRFQAARSNIASQDFPSRLRPLRTLLSRLFRLVGILVSSIAIVGLSVGAVLLIVAWFGNHGTNTVLGYVPRLLIYLSFSSAFFVLMLPFILLLLMSLSRRAARASLTGKGIVMILLPWLIALGILAGSLAETVPHLAKWSSDHPKDPYFQLEVKNHSVENFCLNAGGHCNDLPVFSCPTGDSKVGSSDIGPMHIPVSNSCVQLEPPLPPAPINSFDECAQYYPVETSYPEQCMVPGGQTFVGPMN